MNLLSAWAGTSIFSCPPVSVLLALRHWDSGWDLHIGSHGSQAFGFGLEQQHQFPWATSLQLAGHGTPQPPSSMSHSLIINLFLCICTYILVVLFLWRSLVNAPVKLQRRRRSSLASETPAPLSARRWFRPPTSLPYLKLQSFIPTTAAISFGFHLVQMEIGYKSVNASMKILWQFGFKTWSFRRS